jgi:hypothetical protein
VDHLRTFKSIEQRIANFFGSFHSWAKPDGDGPIPHDRVVSVLDLRAHGSQVDHFLQIATAIRDSAQFKDASTDHQADIIDTITELTAASKEIADATHHERVWERLSHRERETAIHAVHVDPDFRKQLNARIQLKKIEPKPAK